MTILNERPCRAEILGPPIAVNVQGRTVYVSPWTFDSKHDQPSKRRASTAGIAIGMIAQSEYA